MRPAALLFVLLIVSSAVIAQTPYIETFELRLHNLDVVVTDAKGKPVRGLTKDDFVVTENGVSMNLTNFAMYDDGAGTASRSDGAAEPVATPPPPRRFVFFIDELGVQRMARRKLFDSVKTFVAAMREGDVAAVVRPTATEKIVQEFTGDRAAIERALKEAIDESGVEFGGVKQEITNLRWQLKNAATPEMQRVAKRAYADAAARRVEHRLGQVRALTSSLAGMDGKKIVVLVAMGLSAKPGSEAWDFSDTLGALDPAASPAAFAEENDFESINYDGTAWSDDPERIHSPILHDLTATIGEIASSAAANGVTIYALEPDVPIDVAAIRGEASIPGKMGKDLHITADPRASLPPAFQTDMLQNAEVTLGTLADTTGGRWFRGLGNIDDTFRQVSEDLSFYYSIAYRATGNEDNPRRVKVSVRNRPELRVRTRTEVLEKSTTREMSDLVVASLLYPRTVNELGIEVTPGKPEKDRGWFTVPFDVVVPLRNLTFLPREDGGYEASFDLHYAAAGERRDFGSGGKREQTIQISSEQYENLDDITYRYKTGIQVSPGRARIAIGVLDRATKLTGFRTVEVIAE